MKKIIFSILLILFSFDFMHAENQAETKQENNETKVSEFYCAKGIYLSFWAAGSERMKKKVLNIIDMTEVNAVIIDIKNEYGYISYRGGVELAKELGAYRHRTIRDIGSLLHEFKKRGVYVIGRIVVFKDDLLASKYPQFSIHDENNQTWRNQEKLAWTNPFLENIHDYNIAIAKEAVLEGFDEINFDYTRFPASQSVKFETENNEENRVAAISSFLKKARDTLKPINAFISIDTYGYVCWNKNDTGIGHRIEELAKYADFISPMLYPSGFHLGIPEFNDPMENPYEIVRNSLEEAYSRTKIDKNRFRPWLQAFKDYGFDKRKFEGDEIKAQIEAAEDFGTCGWMLWHPASYFIVDGLRPSGMIKIVSNAKKIQSNPDDKTIAEKKLQ